MCLYNKTSPFRIILEMCPGEEDSVKHIFFFMMDTMALRKIEYFP